MADDQKPLPTRTRIFDLVPLRSTADAGQDLDLLASQYGASDDDEAPAPRRAKAGKTLDQLADEYGAYDPAPERRLDERGKVREVDAFGNLVPRAFRSIAPQGPSQKTPGRWSQPKTIDVAPVRQPAFEDTLEGLSRSDIPPAVGDRITDTGVSLLKGAIGIPEAAVGLVDIPAGGRIGKALDEAGFQPGQAKSILERWYSDRLQNQKMEVSEADGVMETAVKALSNPDVVFQAVAESLPVMLAGGVAGRFVPGVSNLATRGAIGEGLMAAGSAEESARQQSPTGLTTRTQGALAVATGASTTALGRLGGAIATKLGLDDIDTLLAAAEFDPIVKTNLVQAIARATVGAGQEGLLEELPQSVVEQWLANASQGKPLMDGVDEAAVLGALSGGVMGFAANIQPIRRPGEGDDAAGGDPQRPYGSVLGRLEFPEDGGDTMDVAPAPEPPPPAPVAPEPPPTSLAALGDENAPAPPAPRSRPDSGPRLMYQIDNPMESDTPVAVQVIMRDGRPAAIFDRGQMIDVPQGLSTLPVERIIAQLIGDHPDGAEPRADLVSRIEQDAAPAPDVEALLAEADRLDAESDAKAAARKAPEVEPFEQDVVHVTTPEGEAGIRSQGFDISRRGTGIGGKDYGPGVYLADRASDAASFWASELATKNESGRVPTASLRGRVRLDRPMKLDARDYNGRLLPEREWLSGPMLPLRERFDALVDSGMSTQQAIGALAREQGHDGLVIQRRGTQEIVAFDPKAVEFAPPKDRGPSVEVVDDTATTENASGESAASAEALSRQEGMKARGERFVVYNRAGKPRDLIGPEAVDYTPKKGETYGVQGPDGFRVLTDNGGKVPARPAVKPGPSPLDTFEAEGKEPWQVTRAEWVELMRAHRRHLGQNEEGGTSYAPNADYEQYHRMAVRDAEKAGRDVPQRVRDDYRQQESAPLTLPSDQVEAAGAIDTTATNPDEMSDEEMAAEIKRRLEAESAPKAPAPVAVEKPKKGKRPPFEKKSKAKEWRSFTLAADGSKQQLSSLQPGNVPDMGPGWVEKAKASEKPLRIEDANGTVIVENDAWKAAAAPKKAPSDETMERIAAEDEAERQAEPGWSNTKPTDVQTGGGIAGLFGGRKPKVGKGGWIVMGRTSMGWGPTTSWSAGKVKADGDKQLAAMRAATDAAPLRIETPDGKLVYETPAWKTRNAGRISATPTARGYVGSYTDGDGTDWYSDEAFPKVDAAFEAARMLAAKRKGPLMHRYTGKRVEYGTEDWNDAANIDKPAKAAPQDDAPPAKAKTGKRPPFEKAPPDGWKAEDKVERTPVPAEYEADTPDILRPWLSGLGQNNIEPATWFKMPVQALKALIARTQARADRATSDYNRQTELNYIERVKEAMEGRPEFNEGDTVYIKNERMSLGQFTVEGYEDRFVNIVSADRNDRRQVSVNLLEPAQAKPADAKPTRTMQEARRDAALDQTMSFGGQIMTRRAAVDKRVAAGATVQTVKGERRLTNPDGAYLSEMQIGKTAMDYAAEQADRLSKPVLSETPRFESGNRVTVDEGTGIVIDVNRGSDGFPDKVKINIDGRHTKWIDATRVQFASAAAAQADTPAFENGAKVNYRGDMHYVVAGEKNGTYAIAAAQTGPNAPDGAGLGTRGPSFRVPAAELKPWTPRATPQVPALGGMTPLGAKADAPATDPKRAALDAQRAALKDEIAAAAAAVRAELKKAANTTNSGLPLPSDALILQTVKLVRLYAKAGIVEAAIGWDYFKTDIGADLAAQAKRAFQVAWGMVHKVAEPALEDSDGTTDRGDANGGQLPAAGRAAADEPGAAREGALGEVPAEADGRSDGERGVGPVDSEARTPDGVRDRGDGGEDGSIASGDRADVPVAALSPAGIGERDPGHAVGDYQLTPERITSIIERGAMERARDNIKAIQIAQDIRAEQRHATAEEQEALAKYVGWGDTNVAKYLAESVDYRWRETEKAVWRQIQGLTTEAERRALVHSTQNAHYTFDLYRPVWAALERAGFTHGRILEPAVGTGHAFGLMPPGMRQLSTLNAVELEPLTATIAQALYPSARVQASGFEKARLPHGTQDLIISNVPFARGRKSGGAGVRDSRLPDFLTDSIHNYFFAKALTYARPGGLVVFVTTHHTMDAPGAQRVRRHLMSQAHFVGAVRLPNTAFGEGAKTEVVTDIVVLQRKLDDRDEARNADLFIESMKTKNGDRSRWYEEHPELIIGTEDAEGTMYGPGQYNVTAREGDLIEQLAPALEQVLTPGLYEPAKPKEASAPPTLAEAEETARFGEFSIGDKGQVFRVTQDRKLAPVDVKGETKKRLVGMIGIRDQLVATRRLMRASGDTGIKAAQSKLRKLYDAFTAQYGLLNARVNRALFDGDPEAINLLALEELESKASTVTDKNGKETLKITRELKKLADIFTKRTINAPRAEIKADTPKAALLASLAQFTGINWRYMASISGQTEAALQESLSAEGRVFRQPDGSWVTDDEYLSGDVVSKLEDAEAAHDDALAPNIAALKRVQPVPKKPEEMRIALGSHWVPAEFVHRFMADLLMVQASDLPMPRYVGTREVGRWMVDNLPSYGEVARAAAKHPLTVEFGHDNTKTEDKPFGSGHIYTVYDLFSDVLNLKVPYLSWTVRSSDGTSTTYKAPEATLAARGNMEELQAEWEAWLGANPVVLNGLTDAYNERFNRTVERKFDGDHLREYLKDNGLTLPYDLHKHQVDAVWRILATGNTLLAHEVGAGKTLEMIIAAMEMRRTGRARKPMITVPTYLLGQWREAITSAYPDAKVLAFDEKDLDAKKRQQAMARIAFGDWDIVLVPHSSFELLRVSPERMVATLEEMVREIEEAELAAGKGRGRKKRGGSSDDGPDVKALAQMRARIEDKIEKLLKRAAKDNAAKNLHWEDLGVDALLVDEAHAFKNLFYFTNMDNIRGLSKSNSDRAIGMYVKTKDLNDVSGSRNLVFATATPVMNSLAEIFTFQRYLQPKQLDQLGLTNFDNWYRMYGKAVPRVEQRPDGSYQEVLRVAEFRNLDHLSKVTRSVMDYVGWPDMPYLKLPKLHGDRIDIVQTPKHGLYDKYIQPWFELRLAVLKLFPPRYDKQKEEYIAPDRPDPISGKPTGKNDNVLAVMTDARKAAIDIRLVLPSAADSKTSRIQQAADRIFDSYKREAKKKGVQLVFLDWGTPKSPEPLEFLSNVKVEAEVEPDDVDSATPATGEDEDDSEFIGDDDSPVNLYAELRAALVKRGIPSREIAFVHQARNAGERVALFTAAQEGRVRVVVGSTDKGGVGMNIQHRMSDIHELDAPRAMRPGDIRQRHGRGIRQGNVYERIRIHRYVTPGTTDEWQYGLLGAKQDLIEAFMRGTATEFSEPDPTTMSVEEAQARASGDPRAAELIELKGKYGRMKAQAAGALRSVAAAKVDAPRLRSAIASKEKDIQKAELFLSEVYQTQRGDGFRVTVGERTFTERKEATAALASVMDSYVARAEKTGSAGDEVIGTIGGIDIVAQWDVPRSWEYDQKPAAAIRLDASKAGEAELTVVAGISERKAGEDAPFNYALLLVNRYEDLSQTARVLQRELEKLQGELSRAENVLANPPAVIERATKARARIDELESALRTESDARMQAAEEGARKAVDAMKSAIDARRSAAPGLPAPSGDASAGPAVTMVVSPGKAATLPATAADQMGLTTARPVFVPELVAFLTDSGGKTQVLKKLRSLGARGFFRDGTVTLAADLFKPENAIELARVLAHEIGHLVDWLPDGDMKRGNLLGRLRTMHRFLKHRYTSADGTTVKVKEVRDELLALSKAWRPWPDDAGPKYDAYRRRGRELYADAISALLNDPAIVQQKAPTFFKEFFSELDEKPEVKQAYIELMDVLSGTPEELIERRRGRVREMFDYGNTKALDLVALKLAERDAMRYSVMDRIRIQHVDRNTALNDRITDWEKEHGQKVPSHEDPRLMLEEQAHIRGGSKGFAAKYFEPVYRALNEAGVDWTTFGEILFYERIVAGDRSEVANPQGLSAENAQEMLDAAFASLSAAQRAVAREQADAFRDALREVADRAYQAGLYTDEMYQQMQENPAYVTFRVLEYLDQNVTSTVYRQTGTLKDIQHVAESSIVKAMVTLNAAEYNRIKRGTFEWFDKNTPGEFLDAPTKWMGKQRGWVPQEPKDHKLKLITYKVKGKTVGKHVDPYVAASFERMGADELGVVLGTLNLLTSKWLRPVFTTMNPGFMTFNLKRDFDRGWKNMDAALVAQGKPRMTLRRWLKRYYQAVPMSVARAFPSKPGQTVAAWRKRAEQALIDAEEAKILDLTLADILGADNLEDTNIDQVFADIGLSSYAAQKGRLKRFVGWVEAAGDFIETLPKAAAIIELTSDGRTVKDLTADERSLIRRKVGSPDYLQRGTKTAASNTLFLFSNAIIQGTRADVEVATDPTTRGGWWFKTAAVNLGPKVLMFALPLAAAALAGGGDDEEDTWLSLAARVMSGVSEYDKTNYVIVPLGLDDNGDSIYARLPQDDTGRLVGGLFWKGLGMMAGDKDAMKSLMQAFDFTAGQLPGSNPLIRAITSDLPAMAAGLNVYDPFRSRMLFTPDELAAMDRHTFKKFVGYEFQQLGGGIVWRFVPGEERPATKSTARTLLDLPIVSNIVGRWLRVGNRGRVEGLRELTSDVRQDEARARLNEKELVNKAIRSLQSVPPPSRARVTAERASAIIKEVYPALTGDAAADKRKMVEKKVRLGLVRGEADEYIETIMSSTSNAQKVAVVQRAKREMAPPKFSAWLRRGQDEGVISKAVAEAARKER